MALKWIGRLLGFDRGGSAPVERLAKATADVAGVFTENKTRRMELDASARQAALAQFGREFRVVDRSWFDQFIDGLNRLPRPALAFGTLALFVNARIDPEQFRTTMEALATIPDPLWWVLGIVISFYFGVRESHYWREAGSKMRDWRSALPPTPPARPASPAEGETDENAALAAWKESRETP